MRDVLVTGASGGIGQAIALSLARQGYGIVAHYHSNNPAAETLADSIRAAQGTVRLLSFDINDRLQTRNVIEQDIAAHGAYYGVICNAGIHRDAAFPALTEDDWDSVIHTNLDSFYNVLQPVVMPMIQRRAPGRIVTISSVSGVMGNRGQVNYSAAKAGIIGATKALAIELAKRRITVNCVAPGVIETTMIEDVALDKVKEMIPMQRFGTPQEVASLVCYLLSDDAAYITRQVISINGGMF